MKTLEFKDFKELEKICDISSLFCPRLLTRKPYFEVYAVVITTLPYFSQFLLVLRAGKYIH